ncbi:helix-turn-helix domain-containing protein [Streptomyces fragilis]|uniref:Helix-turn-helix domain-containing protein n=1 Tax=Streptomyces fragilis TaxID=67301 RepID=A0ABV2YJA6_9ACTN|nr:helix-turn-helix domain-containing protein [Streptomyces fragilis]
MRTVIDLEALPCPERADAWEEAVSRAVLPVTCRFLDPEDRRGRLVSMPLGCGGLVEATHSAMTVERTRRLIRRDDPEVYELVLVTHGGQGVEQLRRQALVRPGEMVLCDSSGPLTARTAVTARLSGALVLRLPQQLVRLPGARLRDLLAVPLPMTSGLGKVLAGLLRGLVDEYTSLSPHDLTRTGQSAVDLATAVLGHFADTDAQLAPDSRRRVLFMKCAALVERHLADPALSPAVVARALGISLRYLQLVFQDQGTTPSTFILERRLARCRRDLADPALHSVPVHAIGARWGFPRSSEFSRAFRKREGVPPGGYRLLVRGSGVGEEGDGGASPRRGGPAGSAAGARVSPAPA